MDYKELIEQLHNAFPVDGYELERSVFESAADAIETLLAERDAAVEDLSKRPHPSTCKYGEHCDYISVITGRPDCYSCHEWEWRGPRGNETS